MAPKSILFAASALAGAAFVAAQAAPNWQYIPSACADQCSQTIESAYTCQNQFSGNSNQIYGCFCNAYPSDADNCASCLTSNDAGALASLLTSTKTACPEAEQKCFFSCSFDTCPDGDVQCACSADYLANIYNCASCNTANNNAGTTQISDFNALRDSCANQNFTGASQSFTTRALPVATTDGYTAPTLTATGGGAAATGDASDLGSPSGTEAGAGEPTTMSAASRTSVTAAGSAAAGSSSRRAATSSMSGAGASGASGASAASGAAQSATPSNAAGMIGVPALGGLLGLAGAIAALF